MKKILSIVSALSLLIFISCGDDESGSSITSVNFGFSGSSGSVAESGGEQGVIVSFDGGAPVASTFNVTLGGTATYGADYTTTPDGSSGSFIMNVSAGATERMITILPVDNSDEDGDRTVIFTLTSGGEGLNIGSSSTFTVTITDDDGGSTQPNDISVVASKFYHTDAITVSFDNEWVTITSSNLPDHLSMYYEEGHPLHADYDEPDNPDFFQNPNFIETKNYVFKIPRYPAEATNKEATPFGPMGVAVNSVAFFNQNAAPGDDIEEELNTFDQYEGHPTGDGIYHYHIEPVWLTQELGADAFLGFLLDGFPVYGPLEDGATITNSDLDNYHGHSHATEEFPEGIYHYHITSDLPWINGDGFYGTAGTLTQ